jgi:hypothetical protein
MHPHDTVRELLDGAEIVAHHHDRQPQVQQALDQLDHGELGRHVDSRRRFVEQQHGGPRDQGAGNEDPLAFAAGHFVEQPAFPSFCADLFERLGDRPRRGFRQRGEWAETAIRPHADDLAHGDGEDRVEALALRYVTEPQWRLSGNADRTIERRQDAKQRLEERRLAAAVRSQKGETFTLVDGERHMPQDRRPVVADGDVIQRNQDGRCSGPTIHTGIEHGGGHGAFRASATCPTL